MPKEASVAPKERVNIVYRPATGGAKEEVELPLKMLVLGDFTFRPDDQRVEDREPISVSKDNFSEVLKAQNIGVALSVPNKLSGKPEEEINVNLKFESIKDFEPEAIAQKTPELNQLLELRKALTALKGPLSNIPEFRRKIQELVKDEATRAQLLKELGVEK
jgi:type VI secretion system protein ImpB